jgi:energy-coupling factor transport system ATP-binding protein
MPSSDERASDEYAIEINGLTYAYPTSKEPVLKGINLRVHKGEFLSIMGPTGAGKSTLCLTLNGIIPQSLSGKMDGTVTVSGMNTLQHGVHILTGKVGIIFQEPESQLFSMNVEEEVSFGPENLGVPPDEIRKRIEWALGVVRMEEFRQRSPFRLSGGQKQRVAIAAALSMMPQILVLDEPTSGLDPIGKMEVFSVVHDLKKMRNMTVVMVEHESEEIARFSDRVAVMNDGRIILEGTPRDVFSKTRTLTDIGLNIPQVCELSERLNLKFQPRNPYSFLTLQEAEDGIRGHLAGSKARGQASGGSGLARTEPKATSDSEPASVQVENLHFGYEKGTEVLRGIDLRIRKGECVAIVGQNGSGKTTLVKHFNGLLRPTSGKVVVDGADTADKTVAQLSKTVGYLFQNPDHQIFSTSVEEEIAFGPRNLGVSPEETERRVAEALKLVGLEEHRHVPPSTLGLGQRRKVTLASIVAMKPDVMVLDEPTTGIDWNGSIQLMNSVRELNKQGHTIITITHNMRVVAQYAERTIVLANGEVILDGPTREVFSKPDILKTTFLAPPQITCLAQDLQSLGFSRDILSIEEFCSNLEAL